MRAGEAGVEWWGCLGALMGGSRLWRGRLGDGGPRIEPGGRALHAVGGEVWRGEAVGFSTQWRGGVIFCLGWWRARERDVEDRVV